MPRQRILWFAISLLILSSLACNAFAGGEPEPALTLPPPPVAVTDTATASDDAITLAPTATLPGAVTDVPLVDAEGNPLLEALVDVNVRTGPGVQYNRDGFLFAGETARVLGRDPVSGWWKIACPGRATGPECWVSGGAQYTKVTNQDGVPVVAVPPTPTPEPSPPPPDGTTNGAANGLLAYTDDTGLWLIGLDMNQNPPAAGAALQLVAALGVENPLISPDGRKVAYMISADEANGLYVVDGDGNNDRILVRSSDLPVLVETDTAVLIQQVQWLSDSQGLAFNTQMVNLIGPGQTSREDLWTVSLEGAISARFDAGQGGGTFDISESNQVVFGQTEAVVRANLDGGDWERVIDFGFVSTSSEYAYSPSPRWAADGSRATAAIPSPEQWSADASVTLWRIPSAGPAEEMETLSGNILFNPVHWSPDGNKLAYVLQMVAPSNPPPVLTLAEGDGRTPIPYTSDAQLTLYGWSPDGARFLYAGSNYYAIGQADVPPTQVAVTGATIDMQWLTATSFVTATGAGNLWNLRSNNLDGDTVLLATANGNFAQFDVWNP